VTGAACRAFEEALSRHFEASGLDAPVPDSLGHARDCPDCRALTACLNATGETLRAVVPPRAPVRVLASLRALPADFPARREAASILDLLAPGTLLLPDPPADLMARLRFVPARARAEGRAEALPAWRRWLGDWRVTVAIAYALTLIIVTVLGVDPLTAARGAASNLTAAGERALADAREMAMARIEATAEGEAEKPLTERLDYRLYRTLAAGRARAVAYAEIAFENVFGGGSAMASTGGAREPDESRENPSGAAAPERRTPTPTPMTEPNGRILRS
jgi:hypothetical protein